MYNELYYLTGWQPNFITKREQRLTAATQATQASAASQEDHPPPLPAHQRLTYLPTSHDDQLDGVTRHCRPPPTFASLSAVTLTSQAYSADRPLPPIRKSKLLSAAILKRGVEDPIAKSHQTNFTPVWRTNLNDPQLPPAASSSRNHHHNHPHHPNSIQPQSPPYSNNPCLTQTIAQLPDGKQLQVRSHVLLHQPSNTNQTQMTPVGQHLALPTPLPPPMPSLIVNPNRGPTIHGRAMFAGQTVAPTTEPHPLQAWATGPLSNRFARKSLPPSFFQSRSPSLPPPLSSQPTSSYFAPQSAPSRYPPRRLVVDLQQNLLQTVPPYPEHRPQRPFGHPMNEQQKFLQPSSGNHPLTETPRLQRFSDHPNQSIASIYRPEAHPRTQSSVLRSNSPPLLGLDSKPPMQSPLLNLPSWPAGSMGATNFRNRQTNPFLNEGHFERSTTGNMSARATLPVPRSLFDSPVRNHTRNMANYNPFQGQHQSAFGQQFMSPTVTGRSQLDWLMSPQDPQKQMLNGTYANLPRQESDFSTAQAVAGRLQLSRSFPQRLHRYLQQSDASAKPLPTPVIESDSSLDSRLSKLLLQDRETRPTVRSTSGRAQHLSRSVPRYRSGQLTTSSLQPDRMLRSISLLRDKQSTVFQDEPTTYLFHKPLSQRPPLAPASSGPPNPYDSDVRPPPVERSPVVKSVAALQPPHSNVGRLSQQSSGRGSTAHMTDQSKPNSSQNDSSNNSNELPVSPTSPPDVVGAFSKSTSASSGFASRAFSITGSPDSKTLTSQTATAPAETSVPPAIVSPKTTSDLDQIVREWFGRDAHRQRNLGQQGSRSAQGNGSPLLTALPARRLRSKFASRLLRRLADVQHAQQRQQQLDADGDDGEVKDGDDDEELEDEMQRMLINRRLLDTLSIKTSSQIGSSPLSSFFPNRSTIASATNEILNDQLASNAAHSMSIDAMSSDQALGRSVFSDSELCLASGGTLERLRRQNIQQLRNVRCDQLKQELNRFREQQQQRRNHHPHHQEQQHHHHHHHVAKANFLLHSPVELLPEAVLTNSSTDELETAC